MKQPTCKPNDIIQNRIRKRKIWKYTTDYKLIISY